MFQTFAIVRRCVCRCARRFVRRWSRGPGLAPRGACCLYAILKKVEVKPKSKKRKRKLTKVRKGIENRRSRREVKEVN